MKRVGAGLRPAESSREVQETLPGFLSKRAGTTALAKVTIAAALLAAAAMALAPAQAARERLFFSARAGVGVEAPPGWTLSLHTGYPKILCLLVHPGGSRISLAVDDAVSARDVAELVAQNRAGLAAQGLEVTGVTTGPRGGLLVDARAPRGKQVLRQVYLLRRVSWGQQAIVLTLTTTPADAAAASGELDWVAARMELQTPARAEDRRARPDGGT